MLCFQVQMQLLFQTGEVHFIFCTSDRKELFSCKNNKIHCHDRCITLMYYYFAVVNTFCLCYQCMQSRRANFIQVNVLIIHFLILHYSKNVSKSCGHFIQHHEVFGKCEILLVRAIIITAIYPHFTVAIRFKGKYCIFKTMCTPIALSLQDVFHS